MPTGTLEELLQTISKNYVNADTDMVRLAYDFAAEAHKDEVRKSGDPYITHPTAAATMLAEMKLDIPIVIACLLHDTLDENLVGLEEIRKNFGDDIAEMTNSVAKLGAIKYRGMDKYAENLRKMFIAMAQDVRVIFIKFADRLHNLLTLDALPAAKAKRIAEEVLEIYAPIANRLGMGEMQGRLEDAAFRYAFPKEYQEVKSIMEEQYKSAGEYHKKLLAITQGLMEQSGIKEFEVQGRVKHSYSLFRKLKKMNNDITQIFDIFAVRVLTNTVADCYAALGAIHSKYVPLKGRIKDYISQPKPNGYQSLHTTVFCEDGKIVEFQFRTKQMHEECEHGILAHWAYDEAGKRAQKIDKKLSWVKELQNQTLENAKIDVFQSRIFVFTPKGDVIDLPAGATPVDFAFAIHADVGMKCSSAKVNGAIAAMDDELQNGDVVDITIDKNRKGPNPDWIDSVKTKKAKEKIRVFASQKKGAWLKAMEDAEKA